MKRVLAIFLVAVILISAAPAAFAAENNYITRGEAADLLLNAADDYNKGVRRSDIIKGNENGDLEENKPVTRVEALVMLSRAFGKLPAPVGDSARNAYSASNFTDIPDWAKSELSNLLGTGIVAGTSAATFSPESFVTQNQMDLFVRRVYALEATNLKDDFYAAVNKASLDSSVIKPGYLGAGAFNDLGIKVNSQVAGIISEIAGGNSKTEGEKKIAALYNNVLNKTARNTAGITPIKSYLDAIEASGTINDLMAVNQKVTKELGANLLLGFGLTVDAKDSSRYTLTFGTFSPLLGQNGYSGATETQKKAYLQYINKLLILSGTGAEDAASGAKLIWDTEEAVAAESLPNHELGNIDKTYNIYTMAQLKALFPNIDLEAMFSLTGMNQTDHIVVADVGQLKAVAALFDQAHVGTLKTFMRVLMLSNYGICLNDEFTQAANDFNAAYLGSSGTVDDKEYAAQIVQNVLSQYLGEAYVSRYFSQKAKSDVENMVSDIISVYKKRINALSWMSADTKAKAIKKLDSMIVKIGYPDRWDTYLDGVVLKSASEGGSFFDNIVSISKAGRARYPKIQNEMVDKKKWTFTPYTVNACYDQNSNSIEFPAAMLQAPFYDINASREENLGGIGYVIAHEITHAFDNNGAKFDEKGNATDWWTAEDYSAFQKLCDKVINFYDGREVAPGITCNGTLTLSENIADLGSVACITQVAGLINNADYKKLYTSMAKIWCSSYTRGTRIWLSQIDLHAPDKLRGGLTLASQEEFYKAFDIGPGDGMYIAPGDRPSIW